jgi:3-phosphoshikimate 1-carboxyvinyltransferase
VDVKDDGLSLRGRPHMVSAVLETHHDHRLAMSFALLSLLDASLVVDSPEVVSKSWPHYFVDMADILGPVVIEN